MLAVVINPKKHKMKKTLLIALFIFSTLLSNAQQWISVSGGVGREISAMVEYNGELVLGGWFSSPGNRIGVWNGTSYNTLGTGFAGTGVVFLTSLCVFNGELYAGGNFSTAGGVAANCLAKWDGTSWAPVGTGLTSTLGIVLVNTLCVYNNELYVGGLFDGAGGVAVNNIARWDGNTWNDVAGGTSSGGMVITMATHKGSLYAGGAFTTMGGTTADRIAKWNGVSWSALGTGNTFTGGNPLALASNGTDLFLGGGFTAIGSTNLNYIGRWNDTTWSAMGTGADQKVTTLFGYNGDIYCGGDFVQMNGNTVKHVAKWSNSSWSGMHQGMDTSVYAFCVYNWGLYAGGFFTQASGSTVNYLAKWDAAIGMGEPQLVSERASFYPNPVKNNATLNIPSEYGSLQELVVYIYDVSGREVKKVINLDSYSLSIDATDLSSGLYIYRINNQGDILESNKFIVE